MLPCSQPLPRKAPTPLGIPRKDRRRRHPTRRGHIGRTHEPPPLSSGFHAQLPRSRRIGGSTSLRGQARDQRRGVGDDEDGVGGVFGRERLDLVGCLAGERFGDHDRDRGVGVGGDGGGDVEGVCGGGGDEVGGGCRRGGGKWIRGRHGQSKFQSGHEKDVLGRHGYRLGDCGVGKDSLRGYCRLGGSHDSWNWLYGFGGVVSYKAG
mmetsp:Transcript_21067/g.43765  ORF Transcript_21067/g.43765 Transcript_21067/m.43765 type:complete len:207 (+) Transcript_21067:517-1137(+)